MKKLALSALTVVSTLAMTAGATGAFFTSTAQSNSNTFSTGTMTLLLTDNNQVQQVTVSDSWEGTNLVPGSVIPQHSIVLRNNGTVNGDHLDFAASYTGNTNLAENIFFEGINGLRFGTTQGGGDSMNMLAVLLGGSDTDYMITEPDGSPLAGAVDVNSDGRISLKELVDMGEVRIVKGNNTEAMDAGTQATLWFNAVVGDDLTAQGVTTDAVFDFNLDQDSSQL